ncbi:hypothetical protein SAMN05421740_1046 [Parapedobacter koreensis]|uniref:Uncharacterized protein n=1 Tax=Parapedobacter koreensis TaxID=332977 RepID=A0A1H7NJ65_9SPHI|nr:hypothetical protein SAMN05421740_1046 [Parapedobacter koreensis]
MATVIENEMLNYFTQLDESEKKSVVPDAQNVHQ